MNNTILLAIRTMIDTYNHETGSMPKRIKIGLAQFIALCTELDKNPMMVGSWGTMPNPDYVVNIEGVWIGWE